MKRLWGPINLGIMHICREVVACGVDLDNLASGAQQAVAHMPVHSHGRYTVQVSVHTFVLVMHTLGTLDFYHNFHTAPCTSQQRILRSQPLSSAAQAYYWIVTRISFSVERAGVHPKLRMAQWYCFQELVRELDVYLVSRRIVLVRIRLLP